MVGEERAAIAPFVHPGANIDMVDDQLTAPVEQVSECLFPIRPVEDVVLLDLDPRQLRRSAPLDPAAGCVLSPSPDALCARRAIRLAIRSCWVPYFASC